MPQFIYQKTRTLEPRPGASYATVYIKQSDQEHTRLLNWLIQVAEQIYGACEINASLDDWFSSPLKPFRRSQKGKYYSAEDLLTDMITQLNSGKDLPESMLHRWNRLTQGTPWEIDLVQETAVKTSVGRQNMAEVFEW